jgi:putative aldouronate transport system permease protein
MIASDILLIGVILTSIGACMSFGNKRMRKKGFIFPLIGSFLMFGGLGGIFGSYDQILQANNAKVPANFPYGFWLFAALAVLIIVSDGILMFREKRNPAPLEPKMEMQDKYQLFLLFLPVLALTFIFAYLPLWGWRYAFFDYKAGGELTSANFVGWKWFTILFQNETTRADVLRVLKNTLGMSGLGILTSWVPLAFAVLLTQVDSKRFRRVVQTFTTIRTSWAGSLSTPLPWQSSRPTDSSTTS